MKLGNKPLPNAPESEKIVIVAILWKQDTFMKITELGITSDHFYNSKHKIIFEIFTKMFSLNIDIDLVSVYEYIKKDKLENEVPLKYLAQINKEIPATAHFQVHCVILIEKYMQRQGISIAYKLYKDIESNEEITSTIYQTIHDLENSIEFKTSKSYYGTELAKIIYDEILKRMDNKNNDRLYTGWAETDKRLGGIERGDVVIVAGRPSMGKSHLAKILTYKWSIKESHVGAYFTLEMTPEQSMFRHIQIHTGINTRQLKEGELTLDEEKKVFDFLGTIHDLKNTYHVEMIPSLTPEKLKSRIKELIKKFNLRYIVIDHVGLMKVERSMESKTIEMTFISNFTKQIALEYNISIIELLQLNRETTKQAGKKPDLSNLKQSGAFEEDADSVIFIHRPEYYGEKEIEINRNRLSSHNITEIILAKNRNGDGTGSEFLYSNPKTHNLTKLDTFNHSIQETNTSHFEDDNEESEF
jgi:replicative DNA helicase